MNPKIIEAFDAVSRRPIISEDYLADDIIEELRDLSNNDQLIIELSEFDDETINNMLHQVIRKSLPKVLSTAILGIRNQAKQIKRWEEITKETAKKKETKAKFIASLSEEQRKVYEELEKR